VDAAPVDNPVATAILEDPPTVAIAWKPVEHPKEIG